VTLSAAFGHLELLVWAVEMGLPLKSMRNDGATPLLQASLHGHIHIVLWLIDKGVDMRRQWRRIDVSQ